MTASTSSCAGAKAFAMYMPAAVAPTSIEHCMCTMRLVHLIFSTKTVKVTSLQMMSGWVIVERIIIACYSSHLSCFRCRLTFICLGEDMSEEEAVEFVTVNDRSGEKRLYFEVCEPIFHVLHRKFLHIMIQNRISQACSLDEQCR